MPEFDNLRIARGLRIPDPVRLQRYLRAPELGPRILFFCGGTALRATSRVLKRYTHNSTHLITAFDSGGSSAVLRAAFDMPAVGDLRNRMMALADESVHGSPEIYSLFFHRLAAEAEPEVLRATLAEMISADHPLVRAVPEPLRSIVRAHLRSFFQHAPESIDLRGASVGNLILAGGYLSNDRDIEAMVYAFSKLVEVRGSVHPIVTASLHLAARCDGQWIVGQHRFTGKYEARLQKPIEELRLVDNLQDARPASVSISAAIAKLIEGADLICFPMGSFYSSLIANLLPEGVGAAIARARCPKVYIPNLGVDPEQVGSDVAANVRTLLHYLRRDVSTADASTASLLDFVLVDSRGGDYGGAVDCASIEALGPRVIDANLVTARPAIRLDPPHLAEALLAMT